MQWNGNAWTISYFKIKTNCYMNNLSLKNGEPNENGTATESENYILLCVWHCLYINEERLYEIAE